LNEHHVSIILFAVHQPLIPIIFIVIGSGSEYVYVKLAWSCTP